LPAAPAAGLESGSSEQSEDKKGDPDETHPRTACVRPRRRRDADLPDSTRRTEPGESAFLEPADFSTVSEIIDRASKESSPNWHEVRQAILSAFYEAKIKRG
jgi:hypothetical protein